MNAALGIADHYGSAEFVTIGVADRSFRILERATVQLIDRALPSAPYHHEALQMALVEAEALIARVTSSVHEHCRKALTARIARFRVGAVIIQSSPHSALPNALTDILASWQLTCAADGMMYRELLATSARELGLVVERYRSQERSRRCRRRGDASAEGASRRVIEIVWQGSWQPVA